MTVIYLMHAMPSPDRTTSISGQDVESVQTVINTGKTHASYWRPPQYYNEEEYVRLSHPLEQIEHLFPNTIKWLASGMDRERSLIFMARDILDKELRVKHQHQTVLSKYHENRNMYFVTMSLKKYLHKPFMDPTENTKSRSFTHWNCRNLDGYNIRCTTDDFVMEVPWLACEVKFDLLVPDYLTLDPLTSYIYDATHPQNGLMALHELRLPVHTKCGRMRAVGQPGSLRSFPDTGVWGHISADKR